MSQLRAGGPVIPGLLRPAGVEYGRNTRRVVTVMGGHAQASLKGGRSCSLGTRNY